VDFSTDPNLEAFMVGFTIVFLAAVGGFTIAVIRHLISLVNSDRL